MATIIKVWSIDKEEFAPYAYVSTDNWEDSAIEYADLVGAEIISVQFDAYTLDNGRILQMNRVAKNKVRREFRDLDLIGLHDVK